MAQCLVGPGLGEQSDAGESQRGHHPLGHGLGIAVGTAISVAAVATGWILSAAGEALCFIANDAARPHIHSHRYGG